MKEMHVNMSMHMTCAQKHMYLAVELLAEECREQIDFICICVQTSDSVAQA